MPRASTRRLRLRPFFPPSGGVRANALLAQRRLAEAPTHALPAPGDTLHLVVLGQAGLPDLHEKAFPLPTLEIRVHGAGAAVLLGQSLPLAAGAKHINNRRENLPCRHRLAPRSWLALVFPPALPFGLWNQPLDLAPQRVRHCPRLDLCHPGRYLHPILLPRDKTINGRNQSNYYLRIRSKSPTWKADPPSRFIR